MAAAAHGAAAAVTIRDHGGRGRTGRVAVAEGGPPDLEDIIRRGQDQLRNIVPGGFNGGVRRSSPRSS